MVLVELRRTTTNGRTSDERKLATAAEGDRGLVVCVGDGKRNAKGQKKVIWDL